MTEATVTITPAETVRIAKRDLALLAKAARLFDRAFESDLTESELFDAAVNAGLTVDRDLEAELRALTGVDTAVELSPEFERALGEAERICGLTEHEADG